MFTLSSFAGYHLHILHFKLFPVIPVGDIDYLQIVIRILSLGKTRLVEKADKTNKIRRSDA